MAETDSQIFICGTEVSIDEVERALKEKLGSESRLVEWEAQEVGQGKGFLSCMARTTLRWNPPDPKLPKTVMVKIPTTRNLEAMSQAMDDNEVMKNFVKSIKTSLKKLHNCEVAAYEVLANGKECPVSMVKVYKSKRMGEEGPAYIVMEDLSEEAGSQDMVNGLNFEQLKQIYEQVGALQAWSLKNDDWKLPELTMNLLDMMEGNEMKMEAELEKFLEEVKEPEWVERLGQHLVDNIHKLRVSAKDMRQHFYIHRQMGIPDVLVHGDFWNNNLLIRKDAAGEPNGDLLAIVDWQIVHPGSPMEDFGRLMSSSVNHEIKRKHEKELLAIYYASLERHLGAVPPFTMEQFMRAYESLMVFMVGMFLPMSSSMIKTIQSGVIKNMDPVKGAEAMFATMRALIEDSLEIVEKSSHESETV